MHVALGVGQRRHIAAVLQFAQPLQRVVEAGHGQEVVLGQPLLAEGVEPFAEFTQPLLLGEQRIVGGKLRIDRERERERVERLASCVDRIVADAQPSAHGDGPMQRAAGTTGSTRCSALSIAIATSMLSGRMLASRN